MSSRRVSELNYVDKEGISKTKHFRDKSFRGRTFSGQNVSGQIVFGAKRFRGKSFRGRTFSGQIVFGANRFGAERFGAKCFRGNFPDTIFNNRKSNRILKKYPIYRKDIPKIFNRLKKISGF